MTEDMFDRTELLLGRESIERLGNSRVAVFGLGGVGGHCAEALARSGIGTLDIIDNDTVDITNLNRQIIADATTVGKAKTDVMKKRLLLINPSIKINDHRMFYSRDTADLLDLNSLDYIADAIDSVSSKIVLIEEAKKCGTPII